VWSDYDCDGIPAGVALTEFLARDRSLCAPLHPASPQRGVRFQQEGITELIEQGITLVITVDLGTTEHENIAYAKEKNIDVIVTDHHQCLQELPPAFAS
jgi:single-stranded-DNA-specific exonuclease